MPEEDAPKREQDPRFVGRVLSHRYRVDALIATGGMGEVYRGEHLRMRKRVAIKVLLPAMAENPHLVARFEREAVAGAHVRHANVAAATDFGQEPDGTCFLVLEFARGITLSEILKRGPLDPWRAARIVRALAEALHAVHEAGIVHRDMKPRNVIVDEREAGDVVKLVDFGLARVQEERLSIIATPEQVAAAAEASSPGARVVTEAGVVVGTVAYMAPEAAQGMDAVDGRSDLYALGIIFYEMLAGTHPFEAIESVELFAAHRYETPLPIRRRAPGVNPPASLEAIVMRLLEKDPDARYQTGAQLAGAIELAWSEAPSNQPPLEEPPSSAVPSSRAPPPAPSATTRSAPAQSATAPPAAPAAPPQPQRPTAGGTIMMAAPQTPSEAAPAPPQRPKGGGTVMMAAPQTPSEASPIPAARPMGPGLMRMRDHPQTAGARLRKVVARAGLDELPGAALVAGALVLLTAAVLLGVALRGGDPAEGGGKTEPSAQASVAPSSSARDLPIQVEGIDAAGWRNRLRSAAESKEFGRALGAVLALTSIDPEAFRDRDLRNTTVAVLVGAEFENSPRADEAWKALSDRLGEDGLDLIYEVVRTRGGTKAARKATTLLRSPEVAARLPVPLRLAFELRTAPCEQKKALFARAASEGDARVLTELTIMREAKCESDEPCCFRDSPALAEAIKQLKERLGK